MFIADGHLDLAFNALNLGRDQRLPLEQLRGKKWKRPFPGQPTVSIPALQAGGVGLVFGATYVVPATAPDFLHLNGLVYSDAQEAHRLAMAQLDYYHRLADEVAGVMLVRDAGELQTVLDSHAEDAEGDPLLGIVPLLEGADPVREPEELELWVERGLRIVGPAWDDTRYAPGQWRGGGNLPAEGHRLLEMMDEFGLILDVTHMGETAVDQALERFGGQVIASHANARQLVPGTRQLANRQIEQLGERGGVIGIVLANPMLKAQHRFGEHKQFVTIEHVLAHIDHICQLLGSAQHVAIGSDLDGGFGAHDLPDGMDSIADLGQIGVGLKQWGYSATDIDSIMGGNWVRLLREGWGG